MRHLYWCFDCDSYGRKSWLWLHNLTPWHRWRVRRTKANDLGEGKS